nr:hypothetical protein NNONMNKP_00052 [Oryctes rhinoceros nudivirus]WIA70052.1 hypothetical protein NFEMFJFI_00044 [Oryctes rhinoceros nudivirus]
MFVDNLIGGYILVELIELGFSLITKFFFEAIPNRTNIRYY